MPEGRNTEVKKMTNGFRIPILAVLLILAAGVCAVSAVQLNVADVNLPNTVDQVDIPLTLDSAVPGGMAGYLLTFTVADTSAAKIVGVKNPDWGVADFESSSVSVDGKTGTLKVADVAGKSTTSLGSVTVQGVSRGSHTTITVHVNELDDASGNSVNFDPDPSGTISVALLPGDILVTTTPKGARIYVDEIDKGTTSLTDGTLLITGLTPKTYDVKATYSGYANQTKHVTVVTQSQVPAIFTLQLAVTVTVRTTPNLCNVYFTYDALSDAYESQGEVYKGTTSSATPGTATYRGNPPGSYTVRANKTGYLGKPITRTLAEGASSTFVFTLSPANNNIPDNTPPYGSVQIDSVGADNKPIYGATIILDGVPQPDLQTSTTPELDVGTHSITVALDGYITPAPVTAIVKPHALTVLPPFVLKPGIPATVFIVPRTINIGRGEGKFLAFVRLPAGYNAADVDPKSVFCDGAPANRLIRTKVFPRIFGAVFNRNKLVDVLPGDPVAFVVSGMIKTKSGNLGFSGIDYIKVIKKPSKEKEDCDDIDKMNDDTVLKTCKPKDL